MHDVPCVNRIVAGLILGCAGALAQLPSDAEIRKILAERVGAENLGSALVVGVIDANGRRVVAYGSLARNDARKLGGDTVFEIGSMSKVFTSLLLMDMARRGEVAVTDPVSKFLRPPSRFPNAAVARLRWRTFPRRVPGCRGYPPTWHRKIRQIPTPIIRFSSSTIFFRIPVDPRHRVPIRVFELRRWATWTCAGAARRNELRGSGAYRICEPLGMANTRVTLTPDMKSRLAVGHNAR